jgi:hypothetical protein
MSVRTTQIGGYGIVRASAAGKTVAAVLETGCLAKRMRNCGFRVTFKNYKRNSEKVQLFDNSRYFRRPVYEGSGGKARTMRQ